MNRIVGTKLEAVYEDERLGDVKDSQADISKARTLLGYVPTVDLEQGLRSTLEWCQGESAAAAAGGAPAYGATTTAPKRSS